LAALARGFSDHHFERGEGPGDEVEFRGNLADTDRIPYKETNILADCLRFSFSYIHIFLPCPMSPGKGFILLSLILLSF